MKTLDTHYPLPGATRLLPIERELAERIADNFYDVLAVDLITVPSGQGAYGIKTRSGYAACVGTVEHPQLGKLPAILHKHDGQRTLEFLEL